MSFPNAVSGPPNSWKRFGLLGSPIHHSRSPAIHRMLLDMAGLSGDYSAIDADNDRLVMVVSEMAKGHWDGLNVTMPLKEDAARAVTELTSEARRSGSVNTVFRENDALVGASTDATTIGDLVRDQRFAHLERVLVLGSGGAAAAVMVAIADTHECFVSARAEGRARDLLARFPGRLIPWGDGVANGLLINATPIESLSVERIGAHAGLIDLPYGPTPTATVRHARQLGIPVVDGIEFLVRQAVKSFELWTGFHTDLQRVLERSRNI